MNTPTPPLKPTGQPRLEIFINEMPDKQMRVMVRRVEAYITPREASYADALRVLILKELPALIACVENRPLPRLVIAPNNRPPTGINAPPSTFPPPSSPSLCAPVAPLDTGCAAPP